MNQPQRILVKLKDTHNVMVKAATRMLKRGEELKTTERRVKETLETSELFMFKTIPWYSRIYHKSKRLLFCPGWWFTSCLNNCISCCFKEDDEGV